MLLSVRRWAIALAGATAITAMTGGACTLFIDDSGFTCKGAECGAVGPGGGEAAVDAGADVATDVAEAPALPASDAGRPTLDREASDGHLAGPRLAFGGGLIDVTYASSSLRGR